jgi:hypothetical protein
MHMHRLAAAVAVSLILALAACSTEPQGSNPLGPCGDDARAPGGYAELEVLLPSALGPDARPPTRVDSGRSCSDVALGTLKSHGITELRFAGATWNGEGSSEGTVIAVFAVPGWVPPLQEAWVEEFYESGAQAGKKTDNIETSRPTIEPAGEVFRLDTLNDLSLQTVVTWEQDGTFHVVIVATDVAPGKDRADHDARVVEAVVAASPVPAPSRPPATPTRPPVTPTPLCDDTPTCVPVAP